MSTRIFFGLANSLRLVFVSRKSISLRLSKRCQFWKGESSYGELARLRRLPSRPNRKLSRICQGRRCARQGSCSTVSHELCRADQFGCWFVGAAGGGGGQCSVAERAPNQPKVRCSVGLTRSRALKKTFCC